jgi:dolichol-phosphate mannosyltransferase
VKTISIIIPVYYNEHSLPSLYEALVDLEKRLLEKDVGIELILVDDGSKDSSFAELLKIKNQRPATILIKHSRNFGVVRALKTGLRYAHGDCFTFLSADLQDPPQLIDQMVEHWLKGQKYVACVRAKRDDPLFSKFFSFMFYKIIRLFIANDFPAGGFDSFVLDKCMLPYVLHSGKNIHISLFIHSLGLTPRIIYYDRQKRSGGKSRWTFAKKVNYFIDSVVGFSVIPIRVASLLGALIAVLSFIYGLVVIMNYIINGNAVPGFSALATLVSFLCGLILIMLGVMGEYIWRIFAQVNGLPESVIEVELL